MVCFFCAETLQAGLAAAGASASRPGRSGQVSLTAGQGRTGDSSRNRRTAETPASTAGPVPTPTSAARDARAAPTRSRVGENAAGGGGSAASGTGGQRSAAYRIPRIERPASSKEPAAKKQKTTDKGTCSEKQKKRRKKDKEPERKKEQKKKKKRQESSSSSSSDSASADSSSEDSSSSSDSDTETISDSSSSGDDRRKKKKRKKGKKMSREDWEAGLELCPLEERPEFLRSRHGPAGRMKLTKLIDTGIGTYICLSVYI